MKLGESAKGQLRYSSILVVHLLKRPFHAGLAKGFNSSVQATRERLGQVAPEEITELPQGSFNGIFVGIK